MRRYDERNSGLEVFSFEIYTKNPKTGEGGWDIKFIRAFGETKDDAVAVLKAVPDFDCIITSTSSFNGTPLGQQDMKVYAEGRNWHEVADGEVN